VRLQKFKNRNSFDGISTSLGEGNYLIDVYPNHNAEPEEGFFLKSSTEFSSCSKGMQRDVHDYHRKSRDFLQSLRDPDESWDDGGDGGLTSLDVQGYKQLPKAKAFSQLNEEDMPAVPPNMLYFRLLLEGYMGYRLHRYHHQDSSMPRCAVMGGAVLACLCAWRDPDIVHMFSPCPLREKMRGCEEREYQLARKALVLSLNLHFCHEEVCSFSFFGSSPTDGNYPFSDGDVDIFMQASPTTRNLLQNLSSRGVDGRVFSHIMAYLGGADFCHEDMKRSVMAAFQESTLEVSVDDAGLDTTGVNLTSRPLAALDSDQMHCEHDCVGGFCFALTHNGLSWQFVMDEPDGMKDNIWPRTSQLIQLKAQADLLGGLLDFDVSTVAVCYDGNDVLLTPRASLSIITTTQTVTPFIMSEGMRNHRRITKYWKRGFKPFLCDPNCIHKTPCSFDSKIVSIKKEITVKRPSTSDGPRDENLYDTYPDRPNTTFARKDQIHQYQNENGIFAVCFECGGSEGSYSLALFEKQEGDAVTFFKETFNWPLDFEREVKKKHPMTLVCCTHCRLLYESNEVFKNIESSGDNVVLPSTDKFLHQDFAPKDWRGLQRQRAHVGKNHGQIKMNFYCGMMFDARIARTGDYNLYYRCQSTLRAKENIELMRHICKHGAGKKYEHRFIYPQVKGGCEYSRQFSDMEALKSLFDRASNMNFRKPSRQPIGLNPERFIAECENCKKWLLDAECDVKYCEKCCTSKLPAR